MARPEYPGGLEPADRSVDARLGEMPIEGELVDGCGFRFAPVGALGATERPGNGDGAQQHEREHRAIVGPEHADPLVGKPIRDRVVVA